MAPLLSIPPFPGARQRDLAEEKETGPLGSVEDWQAHLAALARHRVGGCYWGAPGAASLHLNDKNWPTDADPWSLIDQARDVMLPEGDPRALLALAADKPLTIVTASGVPVQCNPAALVAEHLLQWQWRDPFSGEKITALQAIELCGLWRRLIDSNRAIVAVLGMAHWKRSTVAPLLWNGKDTPFRRGVPTLATDDVVAVWRSRLTAAQDRALAGRSLVEVEDGFIRSAGLGADCVPPLSIIVDGRGVHFDPNQPSELEELLQNSEFPDELCSRAAVLRQAIIAGGLSKYESTKMQALDRPGGARWHILVPGQVEDDRAVTSGGALSSNLELLRRAREHAGPDAFIIYKPHPDVLAGHRKGMLSEREAAQWADRVESVAPMASLIGMVDELHVNSSLAGFEALMRSKKVTVHGVPFYAGWGVTTDLGPVPARRTARRTLDELVAAALLLYPRYLDPQTGLPCPAEVLVQRLSRSASPKLDLAQRFIVAVRRLQGRFRSALGQLRS